MDWREITGKRLTDPRPRTIQSHCTHRGLEQCLAHMTTHSMPALPSSAIIAAQLCAGHKNRWRCCKGGMVTCHLIWFHGTIFPRITAWLTQRYRAPKHKVVLACPNSPHCVLLTLSQSGLSLTICGRHHLPGSRCVGEMTT